MKDNKNNIFTKYIRGAKYHKMIKSRKGRVITPGFYGQTALRVMYNNLDMATVSEYPSTQATDMKIFYGDRVISSAKPLLNFTISYDNIVIEKSIQDVFFARGGNRVGWAHFLKLTIGGKTVDLQKHKSTADFIKEILIELVKTGKIKGHTIESVVRDESWVFSR